MTTIAAIRPDDWGLPLFLHVLGAMVTVGALVTAASFLFAAGRGGSIEAARRGFRALLLAVAPAYVVMRVGAHWIAHEQGLGDSAATWIGIGYAVADIGVILIIAATVAAGAALGRSKCATARCVRPGAMVAAWIVTVMVLAYVVALWAMAAKPT